jgi:DNA topoisomerase-1
MTTEEAQLLSLTSGKIKKIINDPIKTAEAIKLVYVTDAQPGILRVKRGNSFQYIRGDTPVKDKNDLDRIRSLVLPPAWENVWICTLANGHLQATGIDSKKRKQYKYHPLWNSLRNHTKFYRLLEFGEKLPAIRLQLEKDISLPGLPLEKVLATVVCLMERTHIRIGSNLYEKLYGSFGLTTLKDKHVSISGSQLRFTFVGKKGISHNISIKNKKLAATVKKCRDIPGKELFQYYTETGEKRALDSGMVNDYIKQISGSDFTAKDFRTWAGTVQALMAFKELGLYQTQTEAKKKIVEALDKVSIQLGNSRNVCKKYYVHPVVVSLYESGGIEKYLGELDKIEKDDDKSGLTVEEKILMKILKASKSQ